KIEINLPPNVMDSQMPPLTLQMLVENAVKHNIITNEKPLSIYIHAIDNTDIKVTNTKTETPRNVSSFQVGLDNIQKRYKYFTDKKIKVDDSGKFTVQLPVIQPNIAKSA
ncbi:MAG: histidine kinase, partial [Bacteroidota bacterium]